MQTIIGSTTQSKREGKDKKIDVKIKVLKQREEIKKVSYIEIKKRDAGSEQEDFFEQTNIDIF